MKEDLRFLKKDLSSARKERREVTDLEDKKELTDEMNSIREAIAKK